MDDHPRIETTVDSLTEEACRQLGEPVVAAQLFYPRGRWKTGPAPWGRLVRGVLGRGRLDDRLPLQSLLAVTATRVAVFGVEISRAGTALTAPLGVWERGAVTARKERVELSTASNNGYRHHEKRFLRVTLRTPDGELGADMAVGERRSQHVARELAA